MKTKFCFFLTFVVCISFTELAIAQSGDHCRKELAALPRQLDSEKTFASLVQWFREEMIVKRGAPGLVIGISGTDSVLAFLAAAKAFAQMGKPGRVAGIHFGAPLPSEQEFQSDPSYYRQAFWFQLQVLPWLRKMAPEAQLIVDSSIDHRRDGLRWGALVEWSVIENIETGAMRPPAERYWVVGTRNATEERLKTYSNMSAAASVQPLTHLWKSEVLQICRYLGVPQIALEKSCDADCACGRDQLPALNIPEVDALLMVRDGVLSPQFVKAAVPQALREELEAYISNQILAAQFKNEIPYTIEPHWARLSPLSRPLTERSQIEQGSIEPKKLSRVVSDLVTTDDANTTVDLLALSRRFRRDWLAEALALFNVPSLRNSHQLSMNAMLFDVPTLSLVESKKLSRINAALGNYGFSFPQWRFLTQKYGTHPALAEQFGMRQLSRENDVRDGSLPPSNPARDEFGSAFVMVRGEWRIEYRRAYILCSRISGQNPLSLVIRNSSHFFGRDRLPEAVYVRWSPVSEDELNALSVDRLQREPDWIPWPEMWNNGSLSKGEKLKRVEQALAAIEDLNFEFQGWLDRGALARFLEHKLSTSTTAIPLYLGVVMASAPSWRPRNVRALNPGFLNELRAAGSIRNLLGAQQSEERVVLMSGEQGDLP